jgi:hypothetical protein
VPMVDTRASERLQPASAMRRANASSGVRTAGVSVWISSWWSLLDRAEKGFVDMDGVATPRRAG